MKLSSILGRILTDVALRQQYPKAGVCELVGELTDDCGRIYSQFHAARRACKQTSSHVFPVMPANGNPALTSRVEAWTQAEANGTMWRGQYGMNRRKLVRDCWRWAKENGL